MIPVTSFTLLIIASVSITIGFVVGGFIGYTNNPKRKKKDDEKSAETDQDQSPPPLVDPAKYTELVRLWRAKGGADLFVETSGHLLASSEPLNDGQRKRFIDLLKELADWVNIPPAVISENLVEPKITPIEPKSYPSDSPGTPAETPGGSTPKTPPLSAATPVQTIPIPPPPVPPISGNTAQPSPTPVPFRPAPPAPKPMPKPAGDPTKKSNGSMVEQIDEILQEVIESSEKPDKKIRLVEEPNEGVAVWVGNEQFIGIDAVPDPIVKDLIRQAVKEWDRRTEK